MSQTITCNSGHCVRTVYTLSNEYLILEWSYVRGGAEREREREREREGGWVGGWVIE